MNPVFIVHDSLKENYIIFDNLKEAEWFVIDSPEYDFTLVRLNPGEVYNVGTTKITYEFAKENTAHFLD